MTSQYNTEHGRGGGALASETRCLYCHYQKLFLFVILCKIPYFFVCPTDAKDKTGNHQSHFNSHKLPSSQDEGLPMNYMLIKLTVPCLDICSIE